MGPEAGPLAAARPARIQGAEHLVAVSRSRSSTRSAASAILIGSGWHRADWPPCQGHQTDSRSRQATGNAWTDLDTHRSRDLCAHAPARALLPRGQVVHVYHPTPSPRHLNADDRDAPGTRVPGGHARSRLVRPRTRTDARRIDRVVPVAEALVEPARVPRKRSSRLRDRSRRL